MMQKDLCKGAIAMKKWMKYACIVCAAAVLAAGSLWAGTLDEPATSAPALRASGKMEASVSYDTAADNGEVAYSLTSGSTAATGTQLDAQTPRKLVRTADVTIYTADFEGSSQAVYALLDGAGGYVESLYEHGDSTRRLSLHMRVPSEKLDSFLGDVGGVGRVSSRSESTTDMTTQFVDNQARLDTLYAKRERLNALLAQAEDVSDLIEIESAIADTQYQIDSYESRQRSINQQVDMSAVNLTLVEETPSTATQADVGLGERLAAAFEASIEGTAEFFQNLLVFLVLAAPAIAIIAAAVILWRVVRKARARKKA